MRSKAKDTRQTGESQTKFVVTQGVVLREFFVVVLCETHCLDLQDSRKLAEKSCELCKFYRSASVTVDAMEQRSDQRLKMLQGRKLLRHTGKNGIERMLCRLCRMRLRQRVFVLHVLCRAHMSGRADAKHASNKTLRVRWCRQPAARKK
jgi:hypothetical protein